MVDPYVDGLLKKSIYAERSMVKGQLVAILNGAVENRKLQLIETPSRALRRGEIHELILTDARNASPGAVVDPVSYIAFFEVIEPGIVVAGDHLFLAGEHVGFLVGYDETHMPNHMNVVFFSEKRRTGLSLGLNLGAEIRFEHRTEI